MQNEVEKRTAVYELLRASVPPAEIIRLLKYPRRTVYDIKKRYDAELAANGNIAEVAGERSAARKSHSRSRDSLDNLNPEFVKKVIVDYHFEETEWYKIEVYDEDDQ